MAKKLKLNGLKVPNYNLIPKKQLKKLLWVPSLEFEQALLSLKKPHLFTDLNSKDKLIVINTFTNVYSAIRVFTEIFNNTKPHTTETKKFVIKFLKPFTIKEIITLAKLI